MLLAEGAIQSPTAPSKPKPVTPKPETSPQKAWNEAVAQAKANAPQPHVTVQLGDTMAGIAANHGDSLFSVEAANPQIQPPGLLEIGQTITLPKQTPAQVVTGVDNSQVKPIITAMAHANAAPTTQNWDTVKQATYNMLVGSNTAAYPDVAATAEVKQLNALEPHNSNFATATNAALAAAKQQWTQMGVTKSQLGPIINAYDHATQVTSTVNRSLSNPKVRHDPATDHRLVAAKQQANAGLTAAIETSLKNAAAAAAPQGGSNPVARAQASAEAIANRVTTIKAFGPNHSAFRTVVDNAAHDLQVTQPAQQVANAYAHGGAQAAAAALQSATGKAGDPAIALQIIQASKPTVDKIATDMNGLVKDFGPSTEFGQIYGNLSQSVNSATPINMSIQKDGQTSFSVGTTAADMVGKAVAAGVPKNLLVPALQNYYQDAAEGAVTNAHGSALTYATAAQLKQQGNDTAASYLVEGAAGGMEGLRAKTDSDIQAFASTTATPSKMQTTWAAFMNQDQMSHASNQFFANNKNIRQQADTELATISQDGDAVVEARAAFNTYQGQFNGISNQLTINAPKDLATAAHNLTGGGDNNVAFAVSQSTRLNTAISDQLVPLIATKASASGGWENWPGWGSLRSTRSLASATQKNMAKGTIVPQKFSDEVHNAGAVGLSIAGLALTGVNVYANGGFPWSSPTQAVYSTYSGLGFFKYGGETYNALAKAKWLPSWASYSNSGNTSTAGKVLKFFFGDDSQSLTSSPAFKGLGFFYYGAGAFDAGADAFDESSNDWVPTALDSAEALGNAGNAAKPIIAELAGESLAEDIGLASNVVSLAATVGVLGWKAYDDYRANETYQADTSAYLQSGLGLAPGLAQALSSSPDNVSAALQQYAAANHVAPAHLLSELNQQWNENRGYNVQLFIDQAERMPQQPNGTYARTQPYMGDIAADGLHMEIEGKHGAESVPQPLPAASLGQLKIWADALFGNNQVG